MLSKMMAIEKAVEIFKKCHVRLFGFKENVIQADPIERRSPAILMP